MLNCFVFKIFFFQIAAGLATEGPLEYRPTQGAHQILYHGRSLEFSGDDIKSLRTSQKLEDIAGRFFKRQQKVLNTCLTESLKLNSQSREELVFLGIWKDKKSCPGSYQLAFRDRKSFIEYAINSDLNWPESEQRWQWGWRSNKQEIFIGSGIQTGLWNLKGHLIPIWSQEQGHFRGLQPYSFLLNFFAEGASGTLATSYLSLPAYVSSNGRMEGVDSTSYGELDLRESQRVSWEFWQSKIKGRIFFSEEPQKLIGFLSQFGVRTRPPNWVDGGAIVSLTGGGSQVQKHMKSIRESQAKIAGWWIQDWSGEREALSYKRVLWNWDLDRKFYPNWDALKKQSRANGERLLGYVNPYLVDAKTAAERSLFDEARSANYLSRSATGKLISIEKGGFPGFFVDFFNPQARKWWTSRVAKALRDAGFSGWMADFGESFPNPSGPWTLHNEYLTRWREVQNDLLVELKSNPQDMFIFMRGGTLNENLFSTNFWLGDQTVTWDGRDGLASALTGLISGAVLGISSVHADIGGYLGIKYWPLRVVREQELLARSLEMAAYSPMFRTHVGSLPASFEQVFTSKENLKLFKKWTDEFASLKPLRDQLWTEYIKTGVPLVRPMFLECPKSRACWDVRDQYFLGPDILMAPVVIQGARSRSLILPQGIWKHKWSQKKFEIAKEFEAITIEAPLGEPPVFERINKTNFVEHVGEP